MTVKLLLLAMLASIGLSLSGCVVYDHDGHYYRDRDYGHHRDRDYDRRHDRDRDYHRDHRR